MASIRDVARKADVSFITVSRVINTPEKVSLKTQEKVKRAMEELNFSINPIAKALAINKTQVICVYIPDHIEIRNFYVMELISGISQVCSTNFYSFLIIRNFDNDIACDGYIITGVNEKELKTIKHYADEKERKIVFFGETKLKVDCIDVDNYSGAKEIVDYLQGNGHKQIGMISVEEERESKFVKDREEGYLEVMGRDHAADIFYTQNNIESAYLSAFQLLDKEEYTAFFCATDVIALGLIRACNEMNKKVPEHISVAGFDGFGYQNMTIPHVTTMQQPVFDIGKMLTETLIMRVKGGEEEKISLIEDASFCDGDSVRKI